MNDIATALPTLLTIAWLTPLASFTLIVLTTYFNPHAKHHSAWAGKLATGAIVFSCVLSFIGLIGYWLPNHPLRAPEHHAAAQPKVTADIRTVGLTAADEHTGDEAHEGEGDHAAHDESAGADHADHHHQAEPPYYSRDYYVVAEFQNLRLTLSYYIDALTVAMFCMVTLIASCIHFYAQGYMHDELHEFVDHEVTLHDGHHLHRPGRFHRFFQYLSLFCFSMLGVVIAGNIFMVFVFWELVGICSYFLIGFYIERKSASTAANKAFIVNRVGDFGMIIGLMALWGSLGTFAFGDVENASGDKQPGLFSQLRTESNHRELFPAPGMVWAGDEREKLQIELEHADLDDNGAAAQSELISRTNLRRDDGFGYWLLVIAGLGIFCGCVGKSAQFPLHVWLPDAMEGPTPVSALVHSATMVAAGVYLVGRFYPVFAPEVLLVIAYTGCITLIIAATIALTATDIKRVLAYSTVSQLGYMMLALGVGGWLAGMFHLFTHAFFKSLLFMCSGSVIHAVHTNDMTNMGGLHKKMPYTAYTMLIGCLAIIGASIPFVIGLSGYYSKDSILEQALLFSDKNPVHSVLFYSVAGGAALTAFYMFRMWFMTFLGKPRDHHRYEHAHESPAIMVYPLVLLATLAVIAGWKIPFTDIQVLPNLIEQARPIGTLAEVDGGMLLHDLVIPNEHDSHQWKYVFPATMVAFGAALGGVALAAVLFWWRLLDVNEIRHQFRAVYTLLWHKWYFDELYDAIFVQPTLFIGRRIAQFDRQVIDRFIDLLAWIVRWISRVFDALFDRRIVDGTVNWVAYKTWDLGLGLRTMQTGNLRQYVMFIVIATVALFVLISFRWSIAAN